jgi:acid phosphatase (class A)
VLAAALICAACATETPSAPPPAVEAGAGYLSSEVRPDESTLIPPPPSEGSASAAADLAAFEATRALEGTPRWELARHDNALRYGDLVGDFACALGASIDAEEAPAVRRVLTGAVRDASPLIGSGKERYNRPRPFRAAEGPVCIDISPEFAESGSYPSGHSTVGWTYALILAELAPDRASQILARGRAFGESRVVCGVHYPSDIEAGRTTAEAVFVALQSDAGFQSDLAEARAELSSLRASAPAPDAAQCAVENEAAGRTPW